MTIMTMIIMFIMTSDYLTVHLGTQPVMLCNWIHRAWSAVVRASLYLQIKIKFDNKIA